MMRRVLMLAIAVAAAAGCADQWANRNSTTDRISTEMDKAVEERAKRALLPPLMVEMPRELEARPLDQLLGIGGSRRERGQRELRH